MVYMNHTELIFQDILLCCTKKVPESHNIFFTIGTGPVRVETHFLMLAQNLIQRKEENWEYTRLEKPEESVMSMMTNSEIGRRIEKEDGGGIPQSGVQEKTEYFYSGPYLIVVGKRITIKLDMVCTVDNKPSTNQLNSFVKKY